MKKIPIFITIAAIICSCGEQENKTAEQKDTVNPSAASIKEIVGVGKVEHESKIVNLAAPSAGIINTIFKTDGDNVAAGEKLVQLEDNIERLKINEIKSQIQTQRS